MHLLKQEMAALILRPPSVLVARGGVQTSQQTDNCTMGTWRTGETEPCKEEGKTDSRRERREENLSPRSPARREQY